MSPDFHLQDFSEFGVNIGAGNLVGIQPFMQAQDYATAASFAAKLDGYLAAAKERDWLRERSIVVFPEYIGVWLAATGEKPAVCAATRVEDAMRIIVTDHPVGFVRARIRAQGQDKIRDSLFRMKAQAMAHIYHDTFAQLAKAYAVTIVAGSIVLPTPEVRGDELRPGSGPLQNVTAVYRPDGSMFSQLVRKAFLTGEELTFCAAASPQHFPIFETSAGRLAVLICADSWYPASYASLAASQPDIVVVPNNQMPLGSWHRIWQGYDPGPLPADVDPHDVGALVEREAWLKYALAGRLATTGARAGIHVFFRGQLWDLSSDGQSIVVLDGDVNMAPYVDGAALVNVWLPG
ncbi:MAG: hypothetical protein J5I90_18190 [Caldilineales bacterium]|nr:hypothetical protein [Caldilineales bacterium]